MRDEYWSDEHCDTHPTHRELCSTIGGEVMGSFSAWHWLASAPILVLITAIGVVLYFVLRKRPSTIEVQPLSSSVEAAQIHPPVQKVISITYLVGGAFGTIMLLPQLVGVSLDPVSAFAWIVMLAQIAAALYGGWQYWNGKSIGSQVLYWLSWSCVPVISFPLLSYWCAMGMAVFPTIAFGAGHFGADLTMRFGYAGELLFFPTVSGYMLGANLIAVAFVIALDRELKKRGVPRWPLEQQKA